MAKNHFRSGARRAIKTVKQLIKPQNTMKVGGKIYRRETESLLGGKFKYPRVNRVTFMNYPTDWFPKGYDAVKDQWGEYYVRKMSKREINKLKKKGY